MKARWLRGSASLVGMAFLVACGGAEKAIVTITNKPTTVAAGGHVVLNATVNHPHHTGTLDVTWSMTGAGKLTSQTANSVRYNAPLTVPSNPSVTVIATAVVDPSASDLATFTITP